MASSTEQPIAELSGGNQQKAVMGRALASEPQGCWWSLHPTQGVDIASKEALFAILENDPRRGRRACWSSPTISMSWSRCDRVLVIFRGRLVAEFGADWRDHELVAAIEGVGRGE